jgi:predicted regulator of Ras-like GTPase activity (Roadblock/LC7/MglB family)
VTEDIRALSAQFAADPSSLVFLRLGEALRHRGQVDAALKVALQGLSRYPHLPDAHDLYARILADRQDYASAFDEWDTVLRLAPQHLGAHKGIGFLYYRAGEPEHALYHLRFAAQLDPEDDGLRVAVERVAGGREIWDAPMPEEPPARAVEPAVIAPPNPGDPFAGIEGGRDRLLLVDADGLRLGGGLTDREGRDVSDQTAAIVAGTTHEAGRAAKLLELGEWSYLTIEGAEMSICLLNPTADTSLLAAMEAGRPAGQLSFFAERSAKAARAWLERVR